jgi:cytochrome c oxidase subunit 2
MSNQLSRLGAGLGVWALTGATSLAHAYQPTSKFDLQPPVTAIAQQIYDLNVLVLLICAVIFVIVFGFMFWAIFAHRKSAGHQAAQFHDNTTIEVVWTVIPFLILVLMAWPATRTVIAMKDTSAPDLTIKATGYQWKWGYEYLRGEGALGNVADGIRFHSALATTLEERRNQREKEPDYLLDVDNRLVVPVGKKVRVLTTAQDVIHAWWVPAFGVKQDAIPGFIRDTWFRADKIGVYRGQCAELCGREHGFMPIVVEVVSLEDFRNWAAEQQKRRVAASPGPAAAHASGQRAADPAGPAGVAALRAGSGS